MEELLAGLDAVHQAGVVHRVLSPQRVLLASDGPCKIFDFGLALRTDDRGRLTASGQMLGIPQYLSPEQLFNAHHVDLRSDLFSLGVMAYELLSGHLPIETDHVGERCDRLTTGDTCPIQHWCPSLSRDLVDWLQTLMAVRPDQRFRSAGVAQAALATIRDS